jgi:hypothetical protein
MRYAENLAHGYGLVWNAGGERIEGYTNFLWVVYMAIFHALRIPRPVISLCIQASGVLFLALNLFVVYRLADRLVRDEGTALLAVAMTAFYIPLDNWAFQGTEVSIITLLVSIGTLWTLESWDRDAIPWRVWMLAGVTTMIRPDMVVFAAVVVAGASAGRTRWLATMASGAAIVGAWIVAETAFRLWYFGDPLPNTYYLKVTGIPPAMKLTRGLLVAVLFLAQLVPFIAAIASSGRLRRPSRAVVLLLSVFAAQVVYSVLVGGDAWEWWGGSNRFIAIAMPVFFVVAADGAVRVWTRFVDALPSGVSPLVAPAAVVVALIGMNWLAFSITADRTLPLKRLFLIVKPYETASDERAVRAGLALREFTSPDAVVGVLWAGAIPYFSERTSVDLLGKMDRHIAHEPMRDVDRGLPWWAAFHPGHMKWDYAYSIGELKPDIIQAPLWPFTDRSLASQPFLSDYELRPGFSDQRPPDGAALNAKNAPQWFVRKSSPHLQRLAQQ